MEKVVDTAFPALELGDEVYAEGVLEFMLQLVNLDKSVLDDPAQFQLYFETLNQFMQGSSSNQEQQKLTELMQAIILN